MNKSLTVLSALRSFYNAGDLNDAFCCVIVSVIDEKYDYSTSQIVELIKSEYGFDIPLDVIRTLLKRMKRINYVTFLSIKDDFSKCIRLTNYGSEKKIQIVESIKESERENNSLVENIKNFYSQKQKYLSNNEISEILNNFIEQNSYDATMVLERERKNDIFDSESYTLMYDYFIYSEKSDPLSYGHIKSILYGKLVSLAFLQRKMDVKAKFDNLTIYLDSNIVFSLMGYHADFFNASVKELISVIISQKIRLKIFSFTRDEIAAKLRGYLKNNQQYFSNIKVDSIYQVLKRKGLTTTDVILLLENLDEEIEKLGIEIDYSIKGDDLISDVETTDSKILVYKPLSVSSSVKHDLSAINAIKKLRGRPVYLLEKSKFIFLTADSKLSAYDYCEHEHKHQNTFPEVIYRSELASIFWFKDLKFSDNAYIHNFLANYARKKLISNFLWSKFISEIKKSKERGQINDEEIELIISQKETEKILHEKGEAGIDEVINSENVLRSKAHNIELEKKAVDSQIKAETLQKEKELLIKRNEEINKQNKTLSEFVVEKDELLENKLQELEEIRKNILFTCTNEWGRYIDYFADILASIIIVIIIVLNYCGLRYSLIFFILIIGAILEFRFKKNITPKVAKDWLPPFLDFVAIRAKVDNKFKNRCVLKKKKQLNIK